MQINSWRSLYQSTSIRVQEFSHYIALQTTQIYDSAHSQWESLNPSLLEAARKTYEAAKPAIKLAICFLLFAGQTSMFVIGAVVTLLAPEFMRKSIGRIERIWNNLAPEEKVFVFVGGLVAFPITTAIAAFFAGGLITLDHLPRTAEDRPPAIIVVPTGDLGASTLV